MNVVGRAGIHTSASHLENPWTATSSPVADLGEEVGGSSFLGQQG